MGKSYVYVDIPKHLLLNSIVITATIYLAASELAPLLAAELSIKIAAKAVATILVAAYSAFEIFAKTIHEKENGTIRFSS